MAFQPCPGIAQVEMIYFQNDEIVENVYHASSATPWTSASLQALMTAFVTWETTTAAPSRCNATGLFKVIATDLSTADGARLVQAVSPLIVGGQPQPATANHVTVALKADTGKRGRSSRGRTYWVGLADAQVTKNNVIQAAGATFISNMNALIAAVNALSGVKLVVLSRRTNNAPRPNGIGIPIQVYTLIDFTVDSQRRRLPNHNRHH